MTENDKLQMFEDQTIRTAWDEEKEEWYFSVVDVVVALTESPDYKTGRKYWNKLKQRLKEEGNELVTNCHQLKMKATDGKMRPLDSRSKVTPWNHASAMVMLYDILYS